eukprot:377684-Prymnesium_polylepis.2
MLLWPVQTYTSPNATSLRAIFEAPSATDNAWPVPAGCGARLADHVPSADTEAFAACWPSRRIVTVAAGVAVPHIRADWGARCRTIASERKLPIVKLAEGAAETIESTKSAIAKAARAAARYSIIK